MADSFQVQSHLLRQQVAKRHVEIASRFDHCEYVHFLFQGPTRLVQSFLVPRLATADQFARQGVDEELLCVPYLGGLKEIWLVFLGNQLLFLELVESLGHVAIEVVVVYDSHDYREGS